MSDGPENVGEETQVKERNKKYSLKREKELAEFKAILETYGGRSFVWRLLTQCGVFRTSFTGNSTTFFNEGKRQIGLWTLDEIYSADPNAFQKMQNEASDRGEKR